MPRLSVDASYAADSQLTNIEQVQRLVLIFLHPRLRITSPNDQHASHECAGMADSRNGHFTHGLDKRGAEILTIQRVQIVPDRVSD
jgi:hypothetical protein